MKESQSQQADAVIERALQGYAPETVQQASALVSGLLSVLPLDDVEREPAMPFQRSEPSKRESTDSQNLMA